MARPPIVWLRGTTVAACAAGGKRRTAQEKGELVTLGACRGAQPGGAPIPIVG